MSHLDKNYKTNAQRFIGLMSGTSLDGVDVALVEIKNNHCQLLENYLHPIKTELKQKLSLLCSLSNKKNFHHRIELFGELDTQMGLVFADAVNQFLTAKNIDKKTITAIGSHGQTIRHQPWLKSPFTLQIGDPNLIAYHTKITTVADFRRMDVAAGGQGAPLAPAFHNAVMQSKNENRIILNLGGIANITWLPKDQNQNVVGFDTGPANTLLDAHYNSIFPQHAFDENSTFAKQGEVNSFLLSSLLSDDYFNLTYPKSTGREYFSLEWLNKRLNQTNQPINSESIQATLIEFTAQTIADSILALNIQDFQVYACGGGMHNQFLVDQLSKKLKQKVLQTNDLGVDGDYLEAMTFAWLAHRRVNHLTGNLPAVTGAKQTKILGAVYLA